MRGKTSKGVTECIPHRQHLTSSKVTVTDNQDDSQPHIIPDDNDTYPRINQTPKRKSKGPHVILDVDEYDATQRYIHKYNTRSAPKYAYAAAALQAQQFQQKYNV